MQGLTSVFGMGTGVSPTLLQPYLIKMDVPSKLHANLKLRFFFLPGKFWSSPRSISTHKLHALLHLHLEPINHVVFMGSYSLRMGNLILRVASCLDAFSTYPFRT